MNQLRSALLILLALAVPLSAQKSGNKNKATGSSPDQIIVTVNANQALATILPQFFGVNCLSWIDDDQGRADGNIAEHLKNMPCGLIRYPGGTVADNYHWKQATLNNYKRFPYESGPEDMDFDEFMAFVETTGAAPMLVVNTESWARKGDIAGGAREAADWVRYCKEKGYAVKYWEIGNETYWHPVMTAEEYGLLVKQYAKAMRAENPEIIIGVNGHWKADFIGTKERMPKEKLEAVRKMDESISGKDDAERVKSFVKDNVLEDAPPGNTTWWNTVAESCGADIDMLVIHWYFIPGSSSSTSHMASQLKSIEGIFKAAHPSKKYLMCMSEYNCNTDDPTQAALGYVEGIGRFLEGGIDIAAAWPLRFAVASADSLLTGPEKTPQFRYQILSMLANNLTGDFVQVTTEGPVHAYGSFKDSQASVILSGRLLKQKTEIKLSFTGATFTEAMGTSSTVTGEKPPFLLVQTPIEVLGEGATFTCNLHPDTFVMIRLSGKAPSGVN